MTLLPAGFGRIASVRASSFLSALALFVAALGFSPQAQAQLTGTLDIPGAYADLATAITDLNTQGVGAGGVTLNLLAGNPQTAPAGGYTITTLTGSAADPIVIQGNGNIITAPTPQASGVLHDAIFELVGADFVTLQGFDMRENAANTTTAAATNNMTEFGVALFYTSTTDGAQNNSILNNTITLNRTYQNTFGIYSNSTHSSTVVTTSATATGAAGGNSGLRVQGNQISSVNIGMVVIGPTAAVDYNGAIDIGGASMATGNTISDYGTTGTFSGYANVSGTVNGILVRNARTHNISFNSVTSSNGGVTAGTLRGIVLVAPSGGIPSGAVTNTINDNTISLRSGVAGGGMLGISVESAVNNPTSTQQIENNRFTALNHTVAGTAAITAIQLAGSAANGPLVTAINGNVFDSISTNTTGNVTLINNSFTRPANATITVNNNSIVGTFAKTGAGGTVRFYDNFGSSPASVTEINTGNNFSNASVVGTTAWAVWRSADGATPGSRKTVSNNIFSNLTAGTGSVTVLQVDFSDNTFAGNTVSGNTVSGISGGGAVAGIVATSQNQNFSGNTVHTLSSSAASAVTGIAITGGTLQNLSGNKVYNLENTSAAGLVSGITVSGTTVNVFNNVVGDIRGPNLNSVNSLFGINVNGGTTVNLSYNSVRLAATSIGANFGSSALSAVSTPTLTLRNNLLVNLSSANGTGLSVAYRRSSTTLTSYAAASNNNDFFVTGGAGEAIYTDGTNTDATIAAYRSRVSPRDSASFAENPSFLSTSGASADFLDINPAVATQLESGGTPVAGITTDFDGNARDGTTPDVGAFEFNGIALDLSPPSIAFTALGSTTLTTNRTLAATISDPSMVGVGALAPRVYYRKNADPYASTGCTGSEPSYSCPIDYSLIGGVVTGDVVNYFVVAQDQAGTPNIGANPGSGFAATDVNTVTTPPSNPASYTIVPSFPASVNVGTGEAFTSLTNAGGLFAAANSGVFVEDVVVNITSDLAGETGAVALNPRNEEGIGGYSFLIRPSGAPRSITGGNTILLRIAGSDRVTIDGALAGTDRSLTLNSTSVATGSVALLIGSLGVGQGATDITVRNTIIQTGTKGTATITTFGVFVGSNTGAAAGPDNDRFVFENNQVRRASIGMQLVGDAAGLVDEAIIMGNDFGDPVTIDSLGRRGLLIGQTTNSVVEANDLFNIETADAAINPNNNAQGIVLSTGTVNTGIVRNRILDIRYAGASGYGAKGIEIATNVAASNVTVANNFVSGINGDNWNDLNGDAIVGIRVLGTSGGINIWNNSVNLFGTFAGNTSGTRSAAFYAVATATGLDVRNNVFVNTLDNSNAATDVAYAAGTGAATAAPFTAIDFNDYHVSATTGAVGILNGVDSLDLTAWQAATGQDASSISADPLFVSSTDLHLQLTPVLSPAALAGTPIALVTNDIDDEARPATSPDMGADQAVFNAAPTITAAAAVTRQQGSPAAVADLAMVSDAETPAGDLVVDATAVPAGITLGTIGNTAGLASASLAAECFADLGTNLIDLRVTDPQGATATDVFTVNVTDNTTPTQGTYPTSNVTAGAGIVVAPSAAPSDNGQVLLLFASAPGFTGSFSGDPVTGQVTVTNAGGVGMFTVTVTAVDNCDEFSTTTFQLNVGAANTAPTIAAVATSRVAGDAVSTSVIANVSDAQDAPTALTLTVNGAASAAVNGVMVESLVADAGGVVSASVVASCAAADASFTLRATDSGMLFSEATLNVTVVANSAPMLAYAASTSAVFGESFTVVPTSGPSDSGAIASVAVQSVGTFTGTASVDGNGDVDLGAAAPVGTHTLQIRITDNCGAFTDAPLGLDIARASSTTQITSDMPDSSYNGQVISVSYVVVAVSPGAGTPSGNVTVSDGIDSCVASVAVGQCSMVLTTTGNRVLTATYAGDDNFEGSSDTEDHSVTSAADLSILKSVSTAQLGSGLIQYTLLVDNAGPDDVIGANVVDNFDPTQTGITWTCAGFDGGSCAANGSGDIDELVDLPIGGSVLFSISANVPVPLPMAIGNTATVAAPMGTTDIVSGNDSSSVTTEPVGIFSDGFEDTLLFKLMALPVSGTPSNLSLAGDSYASMARGRDPVDVAGFSIGGQRVLLQVRKIGGTVLLELLQQASNGAWSGGTLVEPNATRAPSLSWRLESNHSARIELHAE